jgi:uncharacterized protein
MTVVGDVETEWWAAIERHELTFQWCSDCGHFQHPPRPQCVLCHHASGLEWRAHGGTGIMHAATQLFTTTNPAFEFRVPYWIGVALLDPGIYLLANMRSGTSEPQARPGAPVVVSIEDFAGRTVPVLVPGPAGA